MTDLNSYDPELAAIEEPLPREQSFVTDSSPVSEASASLIYFNTRHLLAICHKNKVGYLEPLAREESALVIAVSEIWLHYGIEDKEIKIKIYIIRSDHKGKGDGGLCFYVHISKHLLCFSHILIIFVKA